MRTQAASFLTLHRWSHCYRRLELRKTIQWFTALIAVVAPQAYGSALSATDDYIWIAAAKPVIANYAWQRDLVMVIGSKLPPDAAKAIMKLHRSIPESDLPESDRFVLPPGPFLLVRNFKGVGGQFEMSLTTGPIRKGELNSCGVTTTYTIVRGMRAKWKISDLVSVAVC